MKVVMTLVVRDEVDILDAHLAFHLNAGVDRVLAVDHGSTDGTTEILERYAREGLVRFFREEDRRNRQGAWVTRLADLAVREEKADWILLSDGDEFWWPRRGSLKDVLAVIPDRYGVLSAPSRTFLPRPDDRRRSFLEHMTVRLAGDAPINDPAGPFRPVSKLAVRAHPDVSVRSGNHAVEGVPFARLETWHPIEIFHFPLRSSEQCAAKYEKTLEAWERNPRGDLARARTMALELRLDSFYGRVVVDDSELARGLADGSLASDTRLRDALRSLAQMPELPASGARFALPVNGSPPLAGPTPTLTEEIRYAVELALLREADAVRGRRALDDLEPRVLELERRAWPRLTGAVRSSAWRRKGLVKLVMTLLVRDEADVLESQLAFHLAQGIDFVVATDHRSTDGTREILEQFAREGYVHVIRRDEDVLRQAEWVSGMARLAATEFGADWVINADGDEFWWPRLGPLKEILAAVPKRFGILRGFQRHFAPRADEDGHFAERMIVRVTARAPTTQRGDPFQGAMAVIHRADPAVSLIPGSHDVASGGLLAVRGWYPFEVLHFPLRTLEQSRRKFMHKTNAVRLEPRAVGLHTVNAARAIGESRYESWYASYVVDRAAVAAGVADGSLMLDTRLRDELRRLARVDELPGSSLPRFARPGEAAPPIFLPGSLEDEALYADEMQVHDEFDSQAKAIRRIEKLERRVGALERARSAVGSRVRALRSTRRES